jgi:hypothetical protein
MKSTVFGARCSVTGRSRVPAALGPGVYSASNRNDYQKHKNNNVSGEKSAADAQG